jgi:hypothetical protein
MRFQISTAVAMLIFLLAQPATAEVLLIDSIHQAPMNSAEGVLAPIAA